MGNFDEIKKALSYIDAHLDQSLTIESLAERFHFSPFYFHRMFTAIVGKPIGVYIRDRRLMQAGVWLASTERTLVEIGMACGYAAPQSFSRAFKERYGISPSEYRRQGFRPDVITVDELIMRFTNRLKGGVFVHPKIIKRDELKIAGVSGAGDKTWDVWNQFEQLSEKQPLALKRSENGYEVRFADQSNLRHDVHVGYDVAEGAVPAPYKVLAIPVGQYACFDVYVANGYTSENNAIEEWLESNEAGYVERLLDETHFCVEYYDVRFCGEEAGSIVEIWIPIKKI